MLDTVCAGRRHHFSMLLSSMKYAVYDSGWCAVRVEKSQLGKLDKDIEIHSDSMFVCMVSYIYEC